MGRLQVLQQVLGRAYAGGTPGFWQQQAFRFPLGQRFARVSVVEMARYDARVPRPRC